MQIIILDSEDTRQVSRGDVEVKEALDSMNFYAISTMLRRV